MKNDEQNEPISFTPRELQIIAYLLLETVHWKIARYMHTSQNTVEAQIKHLRQKVNAKSCQGLITYALLHGYTLHESTGKVFYKGKLIELPD